MPSRQEWQVIVAELEASGLSLNAFAVQRGVNRSSLCWWKGRFRREARESGGDAGSKFVPLVVKPAPAPAPSEVVVRIDGRPISLRVARDTDLALLRRVLDALC